MQFFSSFCDREGCDDNKLGSAEYEPELLEQFDVIHELRRRRATF